MPESKHLDSAILTNEKKNIFFRCVEDCSEAIMITNEKGALIYVNPAWTKTYGYTSDEVVGKTPGIIKSGLQEKSFYLTMWEQITRNGQWKGELVNRSKDGSLIPVMLTISPYKAEKNELAGFIGIAVDMSARKELEAEVVHQDRLASVGVLASGLAHEIGTPLGVIRGRAEFLQMEVESETPSYKALEIVISQIDRISNLITTLLGFSRSSSDLNIRIHQLRPIVDQVTLLLVEKFNHRHIELKVDVGNDFKLNCDQGRIQQILMNLLINSLHAIESTDQPGREHFVKITAREKPHRKELSIEDSGCGISPGNLKRIFDPFFTTKEVGKGTGLGLSIVAKLASELNAQISVDSVVGQGTTFTFSFNKD